jgi:hypothetical protein
VATRPSNPRNVDRHGWNLYEEYKRINERKLEEYSFVLGSKLAFKEIEEGGELVVIYEGELQLPKGVTLQVRKAFQTKRMGPGRGSLYVRGYSYRYNAHIKGKHTVLRFDNGHHPDEYHGHWFDIETGDEIERRVMSRDDFPVFSEVLDELDRLMRFTESS